MHYILEVQRMSGNKTHILTNSCLSKLATNILYLQHVSRNMILLGVIYARISKYDPLGFRHKVATVGIEMEKTKEHGLGNCIHADNKNPTLFRWPKIVINR